VLQLNTFLAKRHASPDDPDSGGTIRAAFAEGEKVDDATMAHFQSLASAANSG
jgi:hypothetical protein